MSAPLVTASLAAKVIGPLLLAKHFAAKLPPRAASARRRISPRSRSWP
jgi:hypothetical protein